MKVQCAWCSKVIEEGNKDDQTSHGICPDCFKEIMKEVDETMEKLAPKKAA